MSNIPPLCKTRICDERSAAEAKKRKQDLARRRQQRYRAKLTPEERQTRRDADKTRKRQAYAELTPDRLQEIRHANNTQHRNAYAQLTPDQLQVRREADNTKRRQAYAHLSCDQLQTRRDADNARHRQAYAQLTPYQLQARRDADNARRRQTNSQLTPDQLQACDDADNTRHRQANAQLSPDQLQGRGDTDNNEQKEVTADVDFTHQERVHAGCSTETSPCKHTPHDLHRNTAREVVKTILAVTGGSNASIYSKYFPDEKPTTDDPNSVRANATTVHLVKSKQSHVKHAHSLASHFTEPMDADDASNTIPENKKSLETDEICSSSNHCDSTHSLPDEDRVTDNTAALDIDLNIGIMADEFTEPVEDQVTDNNGPVDVDLNKEILAWHKTNT